jgi:hypothetical protein
MPFLKFIGDFFNRLFHKAEDIAKEIMPKAISFVNNLKNFDTKNPEIVDVLTAIIPGSWDDALVAKARQALPQILTELQVFNDHLTTENPGEFIVACVDELNKMLPNIRGLYLHNIAILLTDALADGKLTVAEITGIIQAVYEQFNHDEQAA